MKRDSSFGPAGLLPLLLLRQAHTRDLAFRSMVSSKRMPDSSVGGLGRKLPVPCSRSQRLRVGVWRTSSWKKSVIVLARPPL
jgi:hypothetical protein